MEMTREAEHRTVAWIAELRKSQAKRESENRPACAAAGGFLAPREFAAEVVASTEAWADKRFLDEFFPTTLGRYADVKSLAAARRAINRDFRNAFHRVRRATAAR
jgi:hypothetical protein